MAALIPPPPHVDELRSAGLLPDETIEWAQHDRVWRIHRTTGAHVLPWNGLRIFGALLRFDHHPLMRGEHPDYGIWYGASSPRGALAEVFQSSRVIDRDRGAPYLTATRFTRPVRLLDVSGIGGGAWATRVGGNHSLDAAHHGRSQHWARTIHRAHQNLDGIIYRGRFAGETSLALFERATDAFSTRPDLSLPLTHPALVDRIATAAHQIGYTVI